HVGYKGGEQFYSICKLIIISYLRHVRDFFDCDLDEESPPLLGDSCKSVSSRKALGVTLAIKIP
ncbi:hypothetical protein, partial [Thermodesulfovibrio yellowstonii]|uniref:hypothetical protein n=1 Tax=Thermodesulfovibrio yellowstonii TaxID=28262 RepID=UPI003C7B9241